MKYLVKIIPLILIIVSCTSNSSPETEKEATDKTVSMADEMYTDFTLTADLSTLSDNQKLLIRKLIEASKIMDELFWYEAYGNKDSLLSNLQSEELKEYVQINYGPWDRLKGNEPFIEGVGPKPAGANFYPADMSKEEFENADITDKTSLYTFIRRDENGSLYSIPYNQMFSEQVQKASDLLKESAELAEDEGFKKYLNLRSQALLDDNYQPSDLAWMDMKSNQIDVVIGPIENYEDALFNYKAAHEAYVLIKDMAWSERLSKYASLLPELQKGIPVDEAYKQEKPGSDADLNAYDVIYYAGDCNAGSKTIAINLPNDEEVQLQKGSRRLQLKNAMRAKYEKILLPIADELIVEEQRDKITFDAFFSNTMFHEVAHGLGIKNTINGKGTVRQALKEHYSALEEGKADILGLYMITQLYEQGELEGEIEEYYTTFMTSIFRSVRFGASSSHGKANMIRFNFFKEKGAFTKESNGKYKVNYDKLQEAANELSSIILKLQGDGDYDGVANLVSQKGKIGPDLQADLDMLAEKGIPVDIVFNQGIEVLGL